MFSVAKNISEDLILMDPFLLKAITSICQDNNYNIRRDGVVFLKENFLQNKREVLEGTCFRDNYFDVLLDFINDEDMLIQVDAIEAMLEVIDEISTEEVENELIPCIIQFMDIEDQS